MKIPNPNNPIFVQTNNGERDPNANVAGSWNCDFSKYPGKVVPSAYFKLARSRFEDDGSLDTISSIAIFDNSVVGDGPYWGASLGGSVWEGGATGSWSEDARTDTPTTTDDSDAVVFDGKLYVSYQTDIAEYDTAWDIDWFTTLAGTPSLSNSPHPMEVIRIGSPLLAIGDDNAIHTVTTGGTVTEDRLTLDAGSTVTWIRSGTSRAFIGVVNNKLGNQCVVYEWDGGDTVPTRQYLLDTVGTLAAVVLNDELYVLTYEMELMKLQGGGFTQVAKFPITNAINSIAQYDGTYEPVPVMPRGMVVYKGKIYINISSKIEAAATLDQMYMRGYPSGVWEFNPVTRSLSHKYSYTTAKASDKDLGQWAAPASTDGHPGAIVKVFNDNANSSILASGSFYTDEGTATNDFHGLYYDDQSTSTKRRARFWTNKLFTDETASFWQKITLKYQKMLNPDDKILIKYKTQDDSNYPLKGNATWSDTDTFTTTSTDFANAVVGDEVFVISGYGGGSSAHISSISEDTGTYTVNLDETVYGVSASDKSAVVVENWKKLTSFNDQITTYKEFMLPVEASSWIQVLVELRSDGGDSPILEEIDIIPTKHQ